MKSEASTVEGKPDAGTSTSRGLSHASLPYDLLMSTVLKAPLSSFWSSLVMLFRARPSLRVKRTYLRMY